VILAGAVLLAGLAGAVQGDARALGSKSGSEVRLVVDGLIRGTKPLIGSSVTLTSVPEAISGLDLIQTSFSDSSQSGNELISFVVDQPTTVYLAFDERCTERSFWHASWDRTDAVIKTSDPAVNFTVYQRSYLEGKVVIGAPASPGTKSMYFLAVSPDAPRFKSSRKQIVEANLRPKVNTAASNLTFDADGAKKRVLIFSNGHGHLHTTIPLGKESILRMAETTGLFDVVVSDDQRHFEPGVIDQYDVIVLNNTNNELFHSEFPEAADALGRSRSRQRDRRLKASFQRYMANGGGLVMIHAAIASQRKWPEWENIVGTRFVSHPWNSGSKVTLRIDAPDHPVTQCFGGASHIEVSDECYQFSGDDLDEKIQSLYSIDLERTVVSEGVRSGFKRPDGFFPLSWTKSYGKGRVFYQQLGHDTDIFRSPVMTQFLLDGILYAARK
jgi:type 1 glutamine amidotransferase